MGGIEEEEEEEVKNKRTRKQRLLMDLSLTIYNYGWFVHTRVKKKERKKPFSLDISYFIKREKDQKKNLSGGELTAGLDLLLCRLFGHVQCCMCVCLPVSIHDHLREERRQRAIRHRAAMPPRALFPSSFFFSFYFFKGKINKSQKKEKGGEKKRGLYVYDRKCCVL
jgi:hypothetical protein